MNVKRIIRWSGGIVKSGGTSTFIVNFTSTPYIDKYSSVILAWRVAAQNLHWKINLHDLNNFDKIKNVYASI